MKSLGSTCVFALKKLIHLLIHGKHLILYVPEVLIVGYLFSVSVDKFVTSRSNLLVGINVLCCAIQVYLYFSLIIVSYYLFRALSALPTDRKSSLLLRDHLANSTMREQILFLRKNVLEDATL